MLSRWANPLAVAFVQLLSGVEQLRYTIRVCAPSALAARAHVAQYAQAGAGHQDDEVGTEQLDQVGTVPIGG